MSYPQGRHGPVVMSGTARDVLTGDTIGAPDFLCEDRLKVRIGRDKMIERISSQPRAAGIDELAGHHAIAGFRRRLRELTADQAFARRPLALLLDDVVGASIISPWIWSKWRGDAEIIDMVGDVGLMENSCIGYRSGASGLHSNDYLRRVQVVPPLGRSDDPDAFHALRPDRDQTMRRVRRIDVWRDGGDYRIDAMFQDSGVVPGTRRAAVHEYRVHASADADGVLTAIAATPGFLPHPECLAAPAGITAMIGTPLADLRAAVSTALRGSRGCTHLNDATRALAEIPVVGALLG